ncbi:GMC oxidoreductase [Sphingobium sp. H39-3-25]|uniref:GMC oxidoreductase n=1 Tax=Sphingobium arseniciresistens TaxID=3030834 RepID=UPI0023B9B8A1|nr:GMC oxidoreductase [Sphingobium arseniciresistens]
MLKQGPQALADSAYPVCVVGSGPVGLALAADLARQGVDTVLLESGGTGFLDPVQGLSAAELVDPARHDEMVVAVARQLGGSSNLWGGRCLPYDPVDFMQRDYVDAGWPIGYDAIEPYMARAVAATCSGAPVYKADTALFDESDGQFSTDALERWVNVQASQTIFKDVIANHPRLHVHTLSTVVGMDFAESGAVTAIDVAHSLSGERIKMPVQRLVIAAGGIETARLLLATQRQTPQRFGGEDGPLGRYYMGHLVGEISDVVFKDAAVPRAFDFFVDRHGSYARRRIVPSAQMQLQNGLLNSAFWPVVPPVADPRHGSAILSAAYLALSIPPLGRMIVAEAIRRRHVGNHPGDLGSHILNLAKGLPSAMAFAISFLRRRHDKRYRLPGFFILNDANRYGLSYHGEQVPRRDSRVWLSGETDRLGLPSLTIDLRFSSQDAESVVRTHDLLEAWLAKHDVGHLEHRCGPDERAAMVLSQASHGTHQIGLTRMGTSRHEGIVDGDLRCFDSPNLFLASCGVLPTSGQANPTFTVVALALRLADALAS